MDTKKKITILLLMLLMLGLLSSCSSQTPSASSSTLREHGLDVIVLLDEMIRSDTYASLMSVNQDILEVSDLIKAGDYTSPKSVYKITVPENLLENMFYYVGTDIEGINQLSEPLLEYMNKRMMSSVVTQVNALNGAMYLATSAIYTGGKTFVNAEAPEDCIYIYTYETGFPIAITFTAGEDGAMTATGNFILDSTFQNDTVEGIVELLKFEGLQIEKL